VGGEWGGVDVSYVFEFAIVYQCDTYAELHLVQDGTLSRFAFTVCAWLDNLFLLIGGLVVEELEIGFRVFFFWGGEGGALKNWKSAYLRHLTNWKNKFEIIFLPFFVAFEGKVFRLYLPGC
jgi:hypothetical protein